MSEIGLFSNLRLLAVVTLSFALQLAVHHTPTLRHIFGIAPVSLAQCAVWIPLGCVPILVLEVRKVWRRRTSAAGTKRVTGRAGSRYSWGDGTWAGEP